MPLPNLQYDNASAAGTARGAKVADLNGLRSEYTLRQSEVNTPSRSARLCAWADFLVLIASMLARREPVSRAGQGCVLHVADLLREEAKVRR